VRSLAAREPDLKNNTRTAVLGYLILNIATSFSIALPAAGITNHLLNLDGFSFGRGILLWIAFTGLSLLVTLPVIPLLQKRIEREG
jgi:hypothetical protein